MAPATANLNGINVDGLRQTVGAIKDKPDLAKFTFRARNVWKGGTHNQAVLQGFYGAGREDDSRTEPFVFDEDEPPILLGGNLGANPVEYVLVGLSGCLTTAMVAHAAAHGIKLNSVESELWGDLDVRGFLGMDPTIRNGYKSINVHFKIDSDEPEEKLKEVVSMAQERSPVFDIVTHAVPVNVSYERA